MSQKQERKLRQMQRRELRKSVAHQQEVVNQKVEEYVTKLGEILKPNPWFIPAFVWADFIHKFETGNPNITREGDGHQTFSKA